jgi:hypothetical protein
MNEAAQAGIFVGRMNYGCVAREFAHHCIAAWF